MLLKFLDSLIHICRFNIGLYLLYINSNNDTMFLVKDPSMFRTLRDKNKGEKSLNAWDSTGRHASQSPKDKSLSVGLWGVAPEKASPRVPKVRLCTFEG